MKKQQLHQSICTWNSLEEKQVIITKPAGTWKRRPVFISQGGVTVFVGASFTQSSSTSCIESHAALLASQQTIIGTIPCARRVHTHTPTSKPCNLGFANNGLNMWLRIYQFWEGSPSNFAKQMWIGDSSLACWVHPTTQFQWLPVTFVCSQFPLLCVLAVLNILKKIPITVF